MGLLKAAIGAAGGVLADLVVNKGQAAIVVDNGRIAEFCAEEGHYTYDKSSDVDTEKSKERAAHRIKVSMEREFESSVIGYDSVRMESSSVSVRDGKSSYALFPVWILNTKYKEANAYIVKDSIVFKKKNDSFLYSKVSKVARKHNGRIS
jgi:hypothetical protein